LSLVLGAPLGFVAPALAPTPTPASLFLEGLCFADPAASADLVESPAPPVPAVPDPSDTLDASVVVSSVAADPFAPDITRFLIPCFTSPTLSLTFSTAPSAEIVVLPPAPSSVLPFTCPSVPGFPLISPVPIPTCPRCSSWSFPPMTSRKTSSRSPSPFSSPILSAAPVAGLVNTETDPPSKLGETSPGPTLRLPPLLPKELAELRREERRSRSNAASASLFAAVWKRATRDETWRGISMWTALDCLVSSSSQMMWMWCGAVW
jgi:hypothetical protein